MWKGEGERLETKRDDNGKGNKLEEEKKKKKGISERKVIVMRRRRRVWVKGNIYVWKWLLSIM